MVFLDLPDTECIQLFVEVMVHKFSKFQRALPSQDLNRGGIDVAEDKVQICLAS